MGYLRAGYITSPCSESQRPKMTIKDVKRKRNRAESFKGLRLGSLASANRVTVGPFEERCGLR
jgi:hypothetical protein